MPWIWGILDFRSIEGQQILEPRYSPTDTSISNSSFISRFRHCSGVSWISILPPGNSHLFASRSSGPLLAMMILLFFTSIAAVTLTISESLLWFISIFYIFSPPANSSGLRDLVSDVRDQKSERIKHMPFGQGV